MRDGGSPVGGSPAVVLHTVVDDHNGNSTTGHSSLAERQAAALLTKKSDLATGIRSSEDSAAGTVDTANARGEQHQLSKSLQMSSVLRLEKPERPTLRAASLLLLTATPPSSLQGQGFSRTLILALSFLSALSGVLFGYDASSINAALPLIKERFHLNSKMEARFP